MQTLVFAIAVALAFAVLDPQVHTVEILNFAAKPQRYHAGQFAYLEWKTRGVDSVYVEWMPDANPRSRSQRRAGLPPTGSLEVQPKNTTRYVLGCESTDHVYCASQSVTVEVH